MSFRSVRWEAGVQRIVEADHQRFGSVYVEVRIEADGSVSVPRALTVYSDDLGNRLKEPETNILS